MTEQEYREYEEQFIGGATLAAFLGFVAAMLFLALGCPR